DHILIADAAGRILAHSPGLAELLGLPPEALQAGAPSPALAEHLPAGMALRSQVLTDGVTAHAIRAVPEPGSEPDNPEIALLRETLDTVDGVIVVYDSDRRYRFGNKNYHDIYPHLPPDEALAGLRYEDVLRLSIAAHAVGSPQAYTDTERFVARRIREIEDRSIMLREEYDPEHARWWQLRTAWTPGGNRVSLRLDVTEIRRLQQELTHAQRLEIIGKLSGSMAHEFNNLLTVVIGSLEMIQLRSTQPEEVAALAGNALAAAESGARLTHEMLTFARRELTRPRVSDPAALLAGMEHLLRRAIGAGIEVEFGPHGPTGHVRVDTLQYEAALLNLAMNASQAIERAPGARPDPKGRVRFRIRGATHHGEPAVAIQVTDTGCGMPPDVVARAFQPFFTTREAGTGPGLGLSQVQSFAAAAGGEVQLESAPGAGTTVTILLPQARAEAPAPAAERPVDAAAKTILVVDDDEGVLATAVASLGRRGYRLLTASDADSALAILQGSAEVDLLFTDIVMPGAMNGVQLAEAARHLRPRLKLLLATGYSDEALVPGGDLEVLRKPYRINDLAARVGALIGAEPAAAA
ncbi:MAG TPA: ATP-binding protein, partial [Acetobacteraceae bacterium]